MSGDDPDDRAFANGVAFVLNAIEMRRPTRARISVALRAGIPETIRFSSAPASPALHQPTVRRQALERAGHAARRQSLNTAVDEKIA
jgi:hypothetical protein